ncbi:MAG TPA: SBBP repeat-containing protein [Thermoanaerobaculia bacterium]
MVCRPAVLLCALSLLLWVPAQARTTAGAAAYGRLPMHFEPNHGQTDARVRFVARGAGYAFFVTDSESVAVLQKRGSAPAVLRMQLLGANHQPHIAGAAPFAGKSHYFLGRDPSQWRTHVPHFGQVRLSGVYDGIDAVYYGNQGELEYDFVVAPGSDPRQIRVRFDGAERIDLDANGDLVLQLAAGEVRQRAPFVYQERDGSRHAVPSRYRRLGAREFGFRLGAYDRALPLVIDPVLAWSTYLGGSGVDAAHDLAVDSGRNVYLTGSTGSTNFPTANALQAANAGAEDAFVAKLNPAGTALVYSTYLGGSLFDSGHEIVVDPAGNAYVAGRTESNDFPTANALQAAFGGARDAFVAKLNPAGSALVYSTYLGGSNVDAAFGLAVDDTGSAYVTGDTFSANFPTANALQAAHGGNLDAFVSKLNPAGSALVYSTYLGGSGGEQAGAIAVDGLRNAYVAGATSSTNFPTANALQASYAGGGLDAYVAKLNPAGTALVYSTYLGGSDLDSAFDLAVDGTGSAHVTGDTISTNFPTANALQAAKGGVYDAFAAKLNPAGNALVYSTYLGGSSNDHGFGIAVDAGGQAYLTGRTASADFPTANAMQPLNAGATDAFVTTLNAAGTALVDSTYLGGTQADDARSIAIDATGVYVAGLTNSSDFPTVNPLQASFGGVQDAFVAKLVALLPPEAADVAIAKAATGAFTAGQNGTFTITVTNAGPDPATGVTVTDVLPAGVTFISATPTQGTCSGTTTITCTLGTLNSGTTATIALIVRPAAPGPLTNTATVTATTADPDPTDGASTAVGTVAPAPAAAAPIPALDSQTLLLLAALLAACGVWLVGRRGV